MPGCCLSWRTATATLSRIRVELRQAEAGSFGLDHAALSAELLEAGFASAYVNVEINLKSLGDKELAWTIRNELTEKQNSVKTIRVQTEVKVGEIIRR